MSPLPSWLIPDGGKDDAAPRARVRIHVVPRASKTEIVGLQGDALKIRLQAPPVDGKANEALCRFFADLCDLNKRAVSVAAGTTSREKTLLVEASPATIAAAVSV